MALQRPEYQDLVAQGVAPRLAEMLSMGCAPALRTGNEFFRGGRTSGSQFAATPGVGDRYAAEARRLGVSTAGKYYSHQLARYPGDPRAWVSDVDDFKRVAASQGAGCEPLGLKPVIQNDVPPPALADDIVEQEVVNRAAEDPGLAERLSKSPGKLQELKEQIVAEHKPHWA